MPTKWRHEKHFIMRRWPGELGFQNRITRSVVTAPRPSRLTILQALERPGSTTRSPALRMTRRQMSFPFGLSHDTGPEETRQYEAQRTLCYPMHTNPLGTVKLRHHGTARLAALLFRKAFHAPRNPRETQRSKNSARQLVRVHRSGAVHMIVVREGMESFSR